MRYIDVERLSAIDPIGFQSQQPYPWINPEKLLTEEGYTRLLETLPDEAEFTAHFGKQRKHGQYSHDRFALEYHDDLNVAQPWKEFIGELRGKEYQYWIRRMIGVRSFELLFHWHYTPNGCSVSPHCDAKRKLGSHIFYFNTSEDWDPTWGGETLLLDDGGRFAYKSAPNFEDFRSVTAAEALGNRSLLFARKNQSWHGVRKIACPEGRFRKVFIVVINRYTPLDRLKRALGKSAKGYD
jgi:Rps23 Pro-64 3,4-dihydroxylase Tpa1-like proline 4-hydroxylase